MNSTRKASAFLGLVVVSIVASATAAFAQTATQTAVVGAATTLQTELIAIGTAVLPLAAAIVALTMGWRMARKFIRA